MAAGWTPDDLRYLMERYNEASVKEIAAALGRSPDAVLRRAQRMDMLRPIRPLTPYVRQELDHQPGNWPCTLEEGITRVVRKILPRIQRRLGTLVEFGDLFNAGYLWMCQNPYYNMSGLEGRLQRLFSDRGINDGATWGSGQSRLDLGATWGPDSAPQKDVTDE